MTIQFGSPEALEVIKADRALGKEEEEEPLSIDCPHCLGEGYLATVCPYCSAETEDVMCPECDGTGEIDTRDAQVETDREKLRRWNGGLAIPGR